MITPREFYRGFPLDGCARSGDVTFVEAMQDLNAKVPTYSKWRVEEITVCNLTQIPGYYTIGFFLPTWNVLTDSINLGTTDTFTPPRSTGGGAVGPLGTANTYGVMLAWSQKIEAVTTRTIPIVGWGLGDERLWAGVTPGHNDLTGIGGISLTISGVEVSP